MADINWSKMLVQIPYKVQDGVSIFVRVPCFLSAETGPDGESGPPVVMLRDRLMRKEVMCTGNELACAQYNQFMQRALILSHQDRSLFVPNGNLYIVVNGWMTRMNGDGLMVHIGYEGCGLVFDKISEEKT